MSKLDIAKMNAEAIASYVSNPNDKTVGKLVEQTLTAYAKVAVRLHHAACITLFHAAQTGDIRSLNKFFIGLRQNDRDALRMWIGKLVTFEVEDENGEVNERRFINFKKDANFGIVKGTEEVRVGFFDLATLIGGKSFMDVNQEEEVKAYGLAELLAMLTRVEKQAKKKAEENGIELPASLKAAISGLTTEATRVGNTLGAATH